MAGARGTHDNEAAAASEGNSHGHFLLHLLRQGNNNNNNNIPTKKDEGFRDYNNRSFSAEGDPWQLTDPAVAELGPSHNFQNPNPNFQNPSHNNQNPSHNNQNPSPNLQNPSSNLPHIWPQHMNSSPEQPFPLLFDQLPRPLPNPHFSPYPFQNHYDTNKPLQPSPFEQSLGGGSHGSAPGPFYGASANGRFGPPPRLVGPAYPYGHMPQPAFPDGKPPLESAWQLQNNHRFGNEGFPFGELRANAIAAKAPENCIGGNPSVQSNYSARNLSENQNFVSRKDVGISHSVASAEEQLIRDGVLQFGSIAWHSGHEKNDMKTVELPNRDILLHNTELPHTLQGQNGVVRFLRRSEGTQANVERKGSRGSSQKGISKGKNTTGVAANHSVYRGETRKGLEVPSSLEMERDRSKTNVRCNGKIQSELSRKELTQCKSDKEGVDNHSLQGGDGDALKKCRGGSQSQQEWRVRQLQADDHMQSDSFDSFSPITGHLSALNVNDFNSCNSNDELNKSLFRRPSNGDEASSSSQPLAFHLDKFGSPPVQVFQNEQSHNEFAEDGISEGKRRPTFEKRVGGNHRVDVSRRRHEESGIKEMGVVIRENPDDSNFMRNLYKYGNRNDMALPREPKDLESNSRRAMPLPKEGRQQSFTKMRRKKFEYRIDLEMLTPQFLTLYESLIPCKEEEAKRKQLISCLEKLVNNQWPKARLHLFGSCANAFGVSKSDIDVCLSIDDESSTKAELVLKLAEILETENMQNVQPLTHARVPIVKFTDPLTGISCDICINNILAIENTKLLHDYAQIDVRLQQLAFMVKHWAKCRQINETYQGTLSSYAYVLMCIHFLQQRRPAIIPCLQEMEATYRVTIGEIECAYFDKVDELKDYGVENKETLVQLLSAFFDYWAFRHDYTNSVISVRTGGLLSKKQKEWTRRIGKERHLICIEDPFEISHDLGRVVDKHSIHYLKDEFQRAAEIMQYDPDPFVKLFEPYVDS